jgi:Transglutaminase-like superfamily
MGSFRLHALMWERLRRFSALDSEARWLFLRAALLLPLIGLSLRVRAFRFTQAALLRFSSRSLPSFAGLPANSDKSFVDGKKAALIARMVRAAARHSPKKPSCLEESLALWFLLRRQAITCELRIGARKVGGNFQAHAWVECDGQALHDTEEVYRHYAALEPAGRLMEAR